MAEDNFALEEVQTVTLASWADSLFSENGHERFAAIGNLTLTARTIGAENTRNSLFDIVRRK
jgi:hypothetical protein